MVRSILVTIALALAGIGVGFGIFAFALGGTPKVAVMNGPQNVINSGLTGALKTQLAFVAADPNIKAVVVRINSPGGSASASEELFTELAKLRQRKPVVVTVQGLAASGAYLMALGANHIIANGTSVVGSVGALSFIPSRATPFENVVGTGPSKLSGGSERTYLELLEQVKEAFYLAVVSQRGDRLKADKEEVLQARVYLGVGALQLGLIDELGDEVDAIRKAAELAGLRRYDVVDADAAMLKAGGVYAEAVAIARSHRREGDFSFDSLNSQFPYIHYLYLPP